MGVGKERGRRKERRRKKGEGGERRYGGNGGNLRVSSQFFPILLVS